MDGIHRWSIWRKYKQHTKSIQNGVLVCGTYPGNSGSPNATPTSTQQMYVAEIRQKREQGRDHYTYYAHGEVDSLCDTFAQRCSLGNLPERTNNIYGTRECSHNFNGNLRSGGH